MTKEHKKKITEAVKKYWEEYRLSNGKRHSYVRTESHKNKMRKIKTGIKMSDDFKKKVKDHHADVSGDKNPMWGTKRPEYVKEAVRKANSRGGITPINKLIRTSFAYLNWRKSVFERDNYTCQMCGNRGGKLNADHIKPFSIYLDLRFDLDNGRTLCVDCHKTTPTYGRSFYKTDLAYEK